MKVVIIGAGVAGLGIGWKLAQSGATVTILERAQIGSGATTSSGGMIAAAAELGHQDTPVAAFAERANQLWPTFAAELEADTGMSIGYIKNGSLMVALKSDAGGCPHAHGENGETAEQPPHSHGGNEAENPHAQGGARLSAVEARAMEPMLSEEISGAMWAPNEAVVDTSSLIRALAVAFVRAGGTILPNETAVRIESDTNGVAGIRTPFAFHTADAYVLAAGAWSARIEGLPPQAVPPVTPVKGEIVVLTAPAGAAVPKHVVWGNEVYVVPRGNRLLVGATAEQSGYDTTQTQDASRWLLSRANGLMPGLADWQMTEHWASLRPASPDGMPILGETIVKGLFVASGQYRNGILFAPAVAQVLSRLILERADDAPAFDPKRFTGSQAGAPGTVVETAHKTVKGAGFQQWLAGF